MWGPLYIAVISLGVNLAIAFGGSAIQKKMNSRKQVLD
ncbi:hypothetical protein DYY66_1851 [Candidatus Nitrosotalea sp. FS]|nr:hypothetical protein [Candidatus Nitrosotalea sp. FS]